MCGCWSAGRVFMTENCEDEEEMACVCVWFACVHCSICVFDSMCVCVLRESAADT